MKAIFLFPILFTIGFRFISGQVLRMTHIKYRGAVYMIAVLHENKEKKMIRVENLTKCYGDFKAVDSLSFEIGDSKVYGFLGPNGAGKTTTMNIITGCLSATSGRVLVGDYDIYEQPIEAKRLIGYLPEQPPLYLNETPAEYLYFVGEAKGLSGDELERQVSEAIHRTGIYDVKYKRIGALSKGYKQRVGIAQALLGNPKVIILDEPTVGLDPIQIIEIRDLIRGLGETHTVIFSSHILSEVQAICDEIIIISKGELKAFDKTENFDNLEEAFLKYTEAVTTESPDMNIKKRKRNKKTETVARQEAADEAAADNINEDADAESEVNK